MFSVVRFMRFSKVIDSKCLNIKKKQSFIDASFFNFPLKIYLMKSVLSKTYLIVNSFIKQGFSNFKLGKPWGQRGLNLVISQKLFHQPRGNHAIFHRFTIAASRKFQSSMIF